MDDLLQAFRDASPTEKQQVLAMPAAIPPPGLESNFDNPSNGNDAGRATAAVCTTLVSLMFLARAYSRVFVLKKAETEDYLGLLSLIPFYAFVCLFVRCIGAGGFLVHQWDLHFGTYLDMLYILTISRFTYQLTMLFIKAAILREWIRLFLPRGRRDAFWWACTGVMLTNTLLYVVAIVLTAAFCRPYRKTWEPWRAGTCFNRKALDVSIASINVAIGSVMLLLPQRIIWSLKATRARKLGVSAIFSIGLVTVAFAAGRTHAFYEIVYNGDTTHGVSIGILWGMGELTGALAVFCTPAIPSAVAGLRKHGRETWPFYRWSQAFGPSSKLAMAVGGVASRAWPRSMYVRDLDGDDKPRNPLRFERTWRADARDAERAEMYSPDYGRSMPLGGIMKTTELERREELIMAPVDMETRLESRAGVDSGEWRGEDVPLRPGCVQV